MKILLPALVGLVGLVVFAITDNAKASAIAKDMFWTGLLVTLAQFASVAIDAAK